MTTHTAALKSADDQLSAAAKTILFLLPGLAAFSRWVSLSPGAAGGFYLYRIVIPLFGLAAIAAIFRSYRPSVGEWILVVAALLTLTWGAVLLTETLDLAEGQIKYVGVLFQLLAAVTIMWMLRAQRERLRYFRWGLIFAAVVEIAIGFWEVATSRHLSDLVDMEWLFSERDIPIGTFVNPNNYALFIVGVLASVFYLAAVAKARRWYLFAAVITVCTLVLCVSTSGVAALTLTLLIAILWIVFGEFRRLGSVVFATMSVLAITAALTVSNFVNVIDFFSGTFSENQDTSWYSRIDSYRYLLGLVEESHFLGIGPGSTAEYVQIALRQYHGGLLINPHNTILEMLVEFGIFLAVPVIAFLVWVVSVLVGSHRRRANEADKTRYLRLEGLSVLATVVTANFIASSLIIETTWWMFIAYGGAIAATLQREWREAERANTDPLTATDTPVQTATPSAPQLPVAASANPHHPARG